MRRATVKIVVDGIYETSKMKVEIGEDVVSKFFKETGNANKRYQREKESLLRLSGSFGFPKLISFDDDKKILKMSRLPGGKPENLSEIQINLLRKMVNEMHQVGVTRHAIPIRDLLSNNSEELGMVDFERVTLRRFGLSPIWLVAKKVSNYHLYRLIQKFQPNLLSESERRFLNKMNELRNMLQKLKPLKNKITLNYYINKYFR